jgi:hypothetical protein
VGGEVDHRVVAGDRAPQRLTFGGNNRAPVWSPDGHWIALSWPSADQWVFVRLVIHSWAVDRVRAVAGIRTHFETRGPTRFGGWCCALADAAHP